MNLDLFLIVEYFFGLRINGRRTIRDHVLSKGIINVTEASCFLDFVNKNWQEINTKATHFQTGSSKKIKVRYCIRNLKWPDSASKI